MSGSVTLPPGTSAIAVTHPSHQVLAAAVAEVAAESRQHLKALQVMFTADHCLYVTILVMHIVMHVCHTFRVVLSAATRPSVSHRCYIVVWPSSKPVLV